MTVGLMAAASWFAIMAGPGDIDLDAFAAQYGFVRTTDAATGREVLRGPGGSLVVAPGIPIALWNNQSHPLPRPVRIVAGRVVVPAELGKLMDAQAPLLRRETPDPAVPPSTERTPHRFRIVLDPGHGGTHTGAKGRTGLMEKDVNLDVSLRLRTLLQAYGVEVVMTRTADTHFSEVVDDDLQRRIDIANRARPDFFLSIHSNWTDSATPRGFEVFVPRHLARSRAGSLAMAQEIQKQFKQGLDTEDRGVKEAGFRVLRGTVAPATLVELEFISNRQGESELGSPAHRQKLAGLLFEGIKKYIAKH